MSVLMAQLRHFAVFVGGGALSALVDIGLLQVLLLAGVVTPLAVTSGFLAGLVVNYIFHQNVTFKARASLPTILRFMVLVLLNYGITLGFVHAAELLGFGVIAGKLASLPVVVANGFLLGKYWIFK